MAQSNWDGLDAEEWSELFGVHRVQPDAPSESTSLSMQELHPKATDYWNSLNVWQRSVYLAEARDAAANEDPPLTTGEIAQTAILFAWQDAPQSITDNLPAPAPPARRTRAGEAAESPPLVAVRNWASLTDGQRSVYLAEARDATATEDPPLTTDEIAQTAILFAWRDTLIATRNDPPNRPVSADRSPSKTSEPKSQEAAPRGLGTDPSTPKTNQPKAARPLGTTTLADRLPPRANESKGGEIWLWALALLGLAVIVFLVLPLVAGDEDSRESSTPTSSTALVERRTNAASAWASTPLPPSVSVKVNAGYRAVSQATADRALRRVVGWYRNVWGLEAQQPVEVRLEPACVVPFVGEVDGYAQLEFEGQVVICVRLDANAPAALQGSEFRDVLAHEYYHAIQYNAPWSSVDALAECPRFLTEGAASFFGQLYASSAVDEVGLGDVLDVFFDTDRWWHYEEGARAFEALVNRFGDAAVRFWQRDERSCSDAFLRAFGISPTRWEEDWRNW